MPRKGPATKRQLVTDPVYGSPLVTALANKVLRDGKRSLAERVVYGALEGCRDKSGNDPVVTLKRALDNVKPTLEVRSRRVGGANYQVPMQVNKRRQQSLAFCWLINACRAAGGRPMSARLADELMAAYRKEGLAMKKRDDTHRMADANKAFAHFAW